MANRIETLLVSERRLLQDVSHELRSPLARLSFAAELARTADDRDMAAAKLKKEIRRLTDIVGTLIEVTRSEGDPGTRSHSTFHLSDLVDDVVEDCRAENPDNSIDITVDGASNVQITGDRELIRRAFENVLRNAIKHSPTGTRIEISIKSDRQRAHVSVRDYGPGVPDELLTRIFQPFFRVDDSRDGATGGLGLGLSIALRAVKLHSGEISARNSDPGLAVEIELPLTNAGA
jgi:two-component system sensor histidine kinase CpxA